MNPIFRNGGFKWFRNLIYFKPKNQVQKKEINKIELKVFTTSGSIRNREEDNTPKRESKLHKLIMSEIAEINEVVNSGTLNKSPLLFDNTIKVINAANTEMVSREKEPHQYAIHRLLRNLDSKDQNLVITIDKSEFPQVEKMAKAIISGDWDDDIFHHLRFGQYAFHAFKEKKNQRCTVGDGILTLGSSKTV